MNQVSKELIFTDRQRLLIDHVGSTFVEACPGAGKTQTIAERFAVRPNSHPRKGVALLSFTNAAADEAKIRCSGSPGLLTVPNFVGTIDKFINRFIVTPVLTAKGGTRPHFVDTWAQLPHATSQPKGIQGIYSLDWFKFAPDGAATLDDRNAPFKSKLRIRALSARDRLRIEQEAANVRQRFIARGYYSAEASRRLASTILKNPSWRSKLSSLLGNRFCEVIVDEMQDCAGSDTDLLLFLQEAGIMTVLVGDIDQGIYEFRRDADEPVVDIESIAPAGERLNGNFRSTPAICALANSLRASVGADDVPCGENKSCVTPIHILGYSDQKEVSSCIEELMRTEGFSRDQTVILAHGMTTARSVAGGSSVELNSNSKLVRIASAVRCLQEESDAKLRQLALRNLANVLHESAKKDLKDLDLIDFLEAIGLSERQFRTSVLRVAMATPYDRKPSVFKTALAESLRENSFDWIDRLTLPSNDKWPSIPSWRRSSSFEYGTVHSYKGLQQQFVTLVLPEDPESRSAEESGVTLWHEGKEGEARRVLYVGATRAQQLLLLAVHDSHLDRVLTCVDRDSVPVRLIRMEDGKVVDSF